MPEQAQRRWLRRRGAAATARDQDSTVAASNDFELVQRLLAGDEDAFMWLVNAYHASMVRLALMYVPSRAVAEEVVQETWLAVLEGLPRFEGRSSLKTWIFRILMNRALSRGPRERRTVPFSAMFDPSREGGEAAVDPDRFAEAGARWPGHWTSPPRSWANVPEERLLGRETLQQVRQAIETLPPSQREVITLRDVDGWSSAEVCNVLGITETNQRVLLHRARSKVRRALERYLDESDGDRAGPVAAGSPSGGEG
jgi:RNA polymerase sigma-70 factor (ECF subfamily)